MLFLFYSFSFLTDKETLRHRVVEELVPSHRAALQPMLIGRPQVQHPSTPPPFSASLPPPNPRLPLPLPQLCLVVLNLNVYISSH